MKTDYELFLEECGLTPEQMEQGKQQTRFVPMDFKSEGLGLYLGDSLIEGTGVYTPLHLTPGALLGTAYFDKTWTALGRFMNHSPEPNVRPLPFDSGFEFVAVREIEKDEELTCNYRHVKAVVQLEADVEAFVNRNG